MKIVIAVDFSFNSKLAIDCVLSSFTKKDTEFIFLNAVYCKHYGSTILENLEVKAILFAQENLDQLKRDYVNKYPEKNIVTAVSTGPIVPSICRFSEENEADLLVIGSNGTSSLFEKIIGSTANGLITTSNTSLLIIPTVSEVGPYNDILYSTDFKNTENSSRLDTLISLTKQLSSKIDIVHVKTNSDSEKEKEFELDMFRNENIDFDLECIPKEAQVIEDQILVHAKRANAQLIITCSHDYGLLTKLFHRSITVALSEETSIPLLIVK